MSRPKPTAQEQDGTPPAVLQIDPAAVLPASPAREPGRSADKKSGKKGNDGKAIAAAPGFSL